MGEDEIEVGNVENFQSEKDQQFSHQSLVMIAMKKVIEIGCKEMIKGHNQLIETSKGTKIIHVSDQRKEYVNSIRNLKSVMICDFDTHAKNHIKQFIKKEKNKRKILLELQDSSWNNLTNPTKEKIGCYIKGYFSDSFPYGEMFLQEQVEIYRKIFEQLSYLTSRVDFYKTEEFEA